MATTTATSTNTGSIANSLNTPARADKDDVSVDCGTIGSSNDEEYIQVYRERILVGGSFFPPDNSESGSARSEWNGMLLDISSLFPATKSETDSSSLFSRPNSNSIMAIFSPHRSTDGSENDEIIIARNPSFSSYFPAYFSDTASSVSNETRLDRAYSAIQHAMSRPEDEFRHVLHTTSPGSRWKRGKLLGTESQTSRPDDGKQQSHRLPLPPITIVNSSPFSHSNSATTSPSVPRCPGRADNPPSPGLRWKKGRLLGTGSFGLVYLGYNSENGDMCAMKEVTLFSDDAKSKESAQQLMQGITLLSRLQHPNIVQYGLKQ